MMNELPSRDAVASAHDAVSLCDFLSWGVGSGMLSDTRDIANSVLGECAFAEMFHWLSTSLASVCVLPTTLEEKCDSISCVTSLS